MQVSEVLKYVDYTMLSNVGNLSEYEAFLNKALKYMPASVCLPGFLVPKAKEYLAGRVKITSVISFPLGYSSTECKIFEAKSLVSLGASEIDMVMNINEFKSGNYNYILDEINKVKDAINENILKVIVETSLLDREEIIKVTRLVSESDANYIKTSTGFGKYGANFEDVGLILSNKRKSLKVKASGGIKSIEEAVKFIELGVDRIGSSKIIDSLEKD